MLSVAILFVTPDSSLMDSPEVNLPERVFTNKILPIEYVPEGAPSTTP